MVHASFPNHILLHLITCLFLSFSFFLAVCILSPPFVGNSFLYYLTTCNRPIMFIHTLDDWLNLASRHTENAEPDHQPLLWLWKGTCLASCQISDNWTIWVAKSFLYHRWLSVMKNIKSRWGLTAASWFKMRVQLQKRVTLSFQEWWEKLPLKATIDVINWLIRTSAIRFHSLKSTDGTSGNSACHLVLISSSLVWTPFLSSGSPRYTWRMYPMRNKKMHLIRFWTFWSHGCASSLGFVDGGLGRGIARESKWRWSASCEWMKKVG